jgi:hypothetical protein
MKIVEYIGLGIEYPKVIIPIGLLFVMVVNVKIVLGIQYISVKMIVLHQIIVGIVVPEGLDPLFVVVKEAADGLNVLAGSLTEIGVFFQGDGCIVVTSEIGVILEFTVGPQALRFVVSQGFQHLGFPGLEDAACRAKGKHQR